MRLLRHLACAAALVATTSPAAAQSGGSSSAMAEALFRQARDLFKAQNYEAACPKFAESQRLEPKLGTLLNLAVCHERQGKTASAWAEYSSATTLARREGQGDRESFARAQAAALERRLAVLVVTAPGAPVGLTVHIDDSPLSGVTMGSPLPIDPGDHRVRATAPGKLEWSTTLKVGGEKASYSITVPTLQDEPRDVPPPAAIPVAPSAAPDPAPAATEPAAPAPENAYGWFVPVGFGVGAVGVLVGSIAGIATLSKAGDIEPRCKGGTCPPSEEHALSEATTLANVSNVAFALGVVGAGVGVAGLVLTANARTDRSAGVRAVIGPGIVGLRGRF